MNTSYKKKVMLRAWQDYKIKKAHKSYENWTFAMSLHNAHKLINNYKSNKYKNEQQHVSI